LTRFFLTIYSIAGGEEIQGEGEGYLVFSQPWPGSQKIKKKTNKK
jgi:hypothetical protein